MQPTRERKSAAASAFFPRAFQKGLCVVTVIPFQATSHTEVSVICFQNVAVIEIKPTHSIFFFFFFGVVALKHLDDVSMLCGHAL